ncbi:hypothetical protein [Dactylosporangium maewongense]|uniref:tetratricopeptide repeat protein n=1 Tax=Dactylosporangium maewongense TaxID=634393 RepID=UPI0031D83686
MDALVAGGDVEAAIATARRHADTGDRNAAHRLAQLLAGAGRVDEMFAFLRPRLTDPRLAEALVEASAGHGRDDEVVALLREVIAAGEHLPSWRREPNNGTWLLSQVLERQGRVDEAAALLAVSFNDVTGLAELLARHGREAELVALGAGDDGERRRIAGASLVDMLLAAERTDEAIGVLRRLAAEGDQGAACRLARWLAEHARVDEAIDALLPVAAAIEPYPGDVHGAVWQLMELLIGRGGAGDALACLDELVAGGVGFDLRYHRLDVLFACGRADEAFAELHRLAAAGDQHAESSLARMLIAAGRLEEAESVLQPGRSDHLHGELLAEVLIRQGRVDEAITVLHAREPLVWGAAAGE